MPRGDGTGPLGTGRRNNCQGMKLGRLGSILGFGRTNSTKQISLEEQATRLEEQAAHLRRLDKENSKNQ